MTHNELSSQDLHCLQLCFVLLVLRLPRLGKRGSLAAFRTFVRFAVVWFCPFPLPLGVWVGLQFVIVAPPVFSLTLFLNDTQFASMDMSKFKDK